MGTQTTDPMAETQKKPTVHSMKRRSFVHEYSYRGYFHVTISTDKLLHQPLGRVCGDLSKPDGDAEAPHVELTPCGMMVQRELLTSIQRHYPMVEVDTYVIMPDHLHILFHATRDIFSSSGKRTHLGRVIAGFKQGCNRRYWEMTGRISAAPAPGTPQQGEDLATKSPGAIAPPTGQTAAQPTATQPATTQPATTAPAPPTCSATALNDSVVEPHPAHPAPAAPLPPLFEAGYCDVIPVDEAQLATQRAYIRNNPRSRLLRTTNRATLMPLRGGIDSAVSLPAMCGYLRRVCPAHLFTPAIWQQLAARFLVEHGHISCDSYGNRELLKRHLLPVVCHRIDAALFATQKARCLEAAAQGAILVSARIAPGEREIMDAAMASGYPVVRILDNGFPERYHPSDNLIDACANSHLLLVSPWQYLFRRKDDAIHVPSCKAMNCIAQALCHTADGWWKTCHPRG